MTIRFRPLATLAAIAALLAAPIASAAPPVSGRPEAVAAAEQKPAAERKAAHPALWKVADEDTTIYLFGTVHALPDGIDWFRGKIAEAFAASDELITEIDDSDPATLKESLLAKARLPEGQSLRQLLSPEERAAYEGALTKLGLAPDALDRYRPWYAAVTLSVLPLIGNGFAKDHGVETELAGHAAGRELERGALETAEFQLSLFDALPLEVQKRYLAQVVASLATLNDDLKAMIEAWKRGDAEELARLMNAQEDDPALIEALLTSRNRTWAGWIEQRLDEPGTVFMAVGAGHLAGPGSVQDQLAAQGIASERVQ